MIDSAMSMRRRRMRLPVTALEGADAWAAVAGRGLEATVAHVPFAEDAGASARAYALHARLWWSFAATLAQSPALRRYLWHLIKGPRTPPLRRLVGDVIRLGLLARAMTRPNAKRWRTKPSRKVAPVFMCNEPKI